LGLQTSMWLSNSKLNATVEFWKIVHHVGSCIMWDRASYVAERY
jgi:hypothetical protein